MNLSFKRNDKIQFQFHVK